MFKDPSTDISSNTAIVDISINSVDDGPESYDVYYSVRLGKTINIDLSANDIDSPTDFFIYINIVYHNIQNYQLIILIFHMRVYSLLTFHMLYLINHMIFPIRQVLEI